MDYLLEARNLSVSIARLGETATIVRNVSFGVRPGEALGIVGESGCGKSITLRALLGILPSGTRQSSGSIWYDGDCVADVKSNAGLRRLRGSGIGMVFQDATSALDPVMRVGNQIGEGLRRHRALGRRASQVESVATLYRLGLPDPERQARQYPHELSGGMRQRAMIGMTTACGPRVLLCDEPTTALDVTTQRRVLSLIDEIRRAEQMALIFVSHDLAVIANMCTQVAVMYSGQIVERGNVADVFAQPRHPYTQGLLRSVPDIESSDARLVAIPGELAGPLTSVSGCLFSPRCALALTECHSGEFPLVVVAKGHETACIRQGEMAILGGVRRQSD